MGKTIGIDLGTTNCCVTVLEGGAVQIVPNKEGGRTTPSVVGFTDKGERLVGQIAKRQAVTNAANTVYAVEAFDRSQVQSQPRSRACERRRHLRLLDSPNGDARVRVQGRSYSPPELSGIVLQRLKAAAEDFLGEAVTDAIITVPLTSTTRNARPPRMRARLPVFASRESSTSPLPPRWLTASASLK